MTDQPGTSIVFGPPRPVDTGEALDLVARLAAIVRGSSMFSDIKSADGAAVKIMAGRELGLGPVSALMGLHVIDGKVELSANLMAARIKEHPTYSYRVTFGPAPEGCTIQFSEAGKVVGESSFTEADRERAGLGMKKDKRSERDPYSPWTKFPANMMFARAMSNGVRWFCPDAFYGAPVYAEGELSADEQLDYFNPDLDPAQRAAALREEAERLIEVAAQEEREASVVEVEAVSAEGPTPAAAEAPAVDSGDEDPTAGAEVVEPVDGDGVDAGEGEPEVQCPSCVNGRVVIDGEDKPCATCGGDGLVLASWVRQHNEAIANAEHRTAAAAWGADPPEIAKLREGVERDAEAATATVAERREAFIAKLTEAYGSTRRAINAWNKRAAMKAAEEEQPTPSALRSLADLSDEQLAEFAEEGG